MRKQNHPNCSPRTYVDSLKLVCILLTERVGLIFKTAATQAKKDLKDKDGNKIFTVPELHWFRKNAYNIGVGKCASPTWKLPDIVRIFNTCLEFMACYPEDVPLDDVQDIALMAMRCHFVIAAALVSLARAEDRVDEQLQRYLEMRRHIASFDEQLESKAKRQPLEIVQDLTQKMSTLFVFDFEGAVALKSWDDLPNIVRKAAFCREEAMFKAMGDCLLRSKASGRGMVAQCRETITTSPFLANPLIVMFTTMRLIINEIFEIENFDNEKLAKYIRCMFQAILPLDENLALQLVDQAHKVAREGCQVNRHFPSKELEWLVASTFNHAIDFYARGEEEACHRWALKAMELAAYMDDEGQLRGLLQDKFAKLRFETRKVF